MSKRPKAPDKSPVDKTLSDAFKAVEAQPVPDRILEHLDRLTGAKPRRDRRS